MKRWLLCAAVLAACGDNGAAPQPGDDAGIDAPPVEFGTCVDRPTDLPRSPGGGLPCDLLPPGFAP